MTNPIRKDILETTLANLTHALEESLFAESVSRRPGWLQTLDPRVKVFLSWRC